MVSYRDGAYYGKKDDEWPTEGVENGAIGIVIEGGVVCFDESTSQWVPWAGSDNNGGGGQ